MTTSLAVSPAEEIAEFFSGIPRLDWSRLDEVHAVTSPILKSLANNKALLRRLVERTRADQSLRAMCERHYLLDYMVVYESVEREFRVRVHIHTNNHKERPHNHRFPFTTYVVAGSYRHAIHSVSSELSEKTSLDNLAICYQTTEIAGSSYTISQDVVHTTFTTDDTVSLIIRGPTLLDKSIIIDRETQKVWWRLGRQEETDDRRNAVTMTDEEFDQLFKKLERMEII